MGLAACQKQNTLQKEYSQVISYEVSNPNDFTIQDAVLEVSVEALKRINPVFNPNAFVILVNGEECASQSNDIDGDGTADAIVLNVPLEAKETGKLEIRFMPEGRVQRDYVKRTQAELSVKTGGYFEDHKYIGGEFGNVQSLRVPDQHTDHSFYIRYEGPGWESDLIAYRFYLDWRNATDIFGKKTKDLVLQDVGLDGLESYLEPGDWGMDILKVGESLGIGAIGMWVDRHAQRIEKTDSLFSRIAVNGPVQSSAVETLYHGWEVNQQKYEVVSQLSINAGSRATKHHLEIFPEPSNLCTGIVKHEDTRLLQSMDENSEWQYLATYGLQSLANDTLGMAVLYKKNQLVALTEDEYSHVVVLSPENGQLDYYFLAVWQQEAPMSETEFINYLNEQIEVLNNPVTLK